MTVEYRRGEGVETALINNVIEYSIFNDFLVVNAMPGTGGLKDSHHFTLSDVVRYSVYGITPSEQVTAKVPKH